MEFRDFVERRLFAAPIEHFLQIEDARALDRFAEGAGADGDFAAFVRIARDLGLDRLGANDAPLMSFGAYHDGDAALFAAGLYDSAASAAARLPLEAITEDVAHSWMRETTNDPFTAETIPYADKPGAYSWAKAPRLAGRPAEVGAVARQAVDGDPLIRALLADGRGTNVFVRVVARLREVARLVQAAEGWARSLRPGEPFCAPASPAGDGQAAAWVEAARGALGHWMVVRNGLIHRYQIIAPTTWNFSPRDADGVAGPLERALEGVEVGALGARAAAVQHVVRSFDPCMVCTAH
jgi:hydrogenase large subunit